MDLVMSGGEETDINSIVRVGDQCTGQMILNDADELYILTAAQLEEWGIADGVRHLPESEMEIYSKSLRGVSVDDKLDNKQFNSCYAIPDNYIVEEDIYREVTDTVIEHTGICQDSGGAILGTAIDGEEYLIGLTTHAGQIIITNKINGRYEREYMLGPLLNRDDVLIEIDNFINNKDSDYFQNEIIRSITNWFDQHIKKDSGNN